MTNRNLVFEAQRILYHIFDNAVKDKFEVCGIMREEDVVIRVIMSNKNDLKDIRKIDIPNDLLIKAHDRDDKTVFVSQLKSCHMSIAV